jgi:hypothetical protein
MERVIVTVKRAGEARVRDLEVPAEVKATQLTDLIAGALQWQSDAAGQALRYEIKAEPLGRLLQPQESLADAGVWDGSWLVFQPVGGAVWQDASHQPPKRSESPAAAATPVSGFRDLGIPIPPSVGPAQPAQPDDKPASGFTWKRLD